MNLFRIQEKQSAGKCVFIADKKAVETHFSFIKYL
jgi:hypothetical protein